MLFLPPGPLQGISLQRTTVYYQRMPPVKSSLLYLTPLALLLGVVLYHSRMVPWSDFAGYYTGGRMLLTGDYMGAYDMQSLNNHIAASGYKVDLVSYAPFPPFTSLVFAPFIVFPMGTAKLLFNLISIVLFLFTIARTIRYFDISPWLGLTIPVIFFIPLVNNIFFGQAYLLLCTLLLEGFIAHRKKQYVLSSFLWGIAILFKLFPGLIFFYLSHIFTISHELSVAISVVPSFAALLTVSHRFANSRVVRRAIYDSAASAPAFQKLIRDKTGV